MGNKNETNFKNMKHIRNKIDKIDKKILDLLSLRFKTTKEIGKIKKEAGLPMRDKKRESEKIKSLRKLAKQNNLNPDFIEKLFKTIFNEVVRTNKKIFKSKKIKL